MINSPKEAEFPLKQEGLTCDEKAKASSSSSSAQWLKLKDPRIVRVSRAFGGKDRHSKVCTIRGLRDRRVRLSVPTAIHLYDLQDRLGLNQPSKVVDWLLNAAKHEIDELPPLPIPPGNFTLGYPSLATSKDVTHQNTSIWKSKSKDQVSVEMSTEKENWMNRNEGDKQGSNDCSGAQQHVLPNNNSNLLPTRANHHHHHPSFLGLLNTMPLGYQLDPSADVTQLANLGFVNHQTDIHSINVVPFPSTLSLSSGNTSQILVCPTGATQPYFPSHVAAMEMDPRQINHYQMLSSSSSHNLLSTNSLINNPSQHLMSQSGKPFSLGRMTAPKLLHSPNRGQDFPSK